MKIRTAQVSDVESILKIVNHEIIHSTSIYEDEPRSLQTQTAWFKEKLASGHPVFIAEEEGVFLGFASYGPFRVRPGYRFSVEHSVYVDPQFRRKKAGEALMQKLLEHAKLAGLHTMVGGVDSENAASLRFHERFGFNKVAHMPQIAWKFNRWLDLVLMQKIL